jgi:exonuclease SbcC
MLVAGEPCPLCGATEHPCHQADSPHGLIQAGLDERVQELREEVSLVEKQITAAQTDLQNQLRGEEEAEAELLAHEQTAAMLQTDIERTVAEMAVEVREHAQDSGRLQARLATLAADLDEVQARENAAAALEKAKQAADTTVENQRHQWLAAVDILRSAERQLRRDEGELLAANSRCEQLHTNQNGIVAELREVMSWCGDGWEQTLQRDPPGFAEDCARRAEEYRSQEALEQQLARDLASAGPVFTQLHGLLGGGLADGGLAAPDIDAARLQTVAAVLAECAITGDARELVSELQQAVSAAAQRRQDEAERLAMAEQRCREADTIVAERSRVHDEHQQNKPADQDPTAAKAAKEQADQACQAAQAQCEEARVKLELDDHERQAVAELEPRIASQEEACRVWQALNDLIGSRDGARFRVFAQSLTLDVLLQTANRHLAELAPRYQLMRVPGHDLDLQVVDLDMAEEIRSVHSLSGGETFLVSLALALALASLSAHETPVESLFIDEGLGTLDTQTLDIALSTLDALQASGRKVGLISHVAGTAERIGVQVRVSPTGGGRSRVEVLGSQ